MFDFEYKRRHDWKVGDRGYILADYDSRLQPGDIVRINGVSCSSISLSAGGYWIGAKTNILRLVRPLEHIPKGTKIANVRADGQLSQFRDSVGFVLGQNETISIVLIEDAKSDEDRKRELLVEQVEKLKAEVAELERCIDAK